MTNGATVSPERLKEIVAQLEKLTTSAEVTAYKNTLTPEEKTALDAYLSTLPKAQRPKAPPKQDLLKDFTAWSEGRYGLTQDELIKNYIDTHNLTEDQANQLKAQIAVKVAQDQAKQQQQEKQTQPAAEKSVPPEMVIKRTPYPKWWNEEGIAPIDFPPRDHRWSSPPGATIRCLSQRSCSPWMENARSESPTDQMEPADS